MARVPIAQENRTNEGGERFPRVKMTEKGQKGRFTVIEEPWREWVHFIKAPIFGEDGLVVKETRYKKNGDPYTTDKTEFISQPICLGNEDELAKTGLDPKNCPGCEASERSGGDIPGPVQRFSVNVIEYTLRGGGWDIKEPFSADVKIWAFTGRIYDEIEGIQREIGKLNKHDITLECVDPGWQRNNLAFKMEPGYTHAPPGYIKTLLTTEGNKATDAQLRDACGRDMPRSRMQEDCDVALRAFRRLHSEGTDPAAGATTHADLAGGIDDLLGEETKGGMTAVPGDNGSMAGADPFDEFDAATTSNPADWAERQERAEALQAARRDDAAHAAAASTGPGEKGSQPAAAASSEAAANPGDFNFDDLLEGIG
jgi:hypothetical protein